MRRQTTYRTLATLGVLAILSAPHETSPQTCASASARSFLGAGLSDGIVNPPDLEDQELFTSKSDFANVFLLMDTSGSMSRLPPNGPAFLLGETQIVPTPGVIGCGATSDLGGLASNPMLDVVAARAYHSPCGTTAYDGLPYQGHPSVTGGVDYAHAASACTYFSSATGTFTNGYGYDPDFYSDDDGLTSAGGARPNLFPKNLVFHDDITNGSTWSYSTGTGTNFDPLGAKPRTSNSAPVPSYGNGWDFGRVYPWQVTSGTPGSIAQFCNNGTFASGNPQNGVSRRDICTTCLLTKGWLYDGNNFTVGQDNTPQAQFPSLWYTGNYLSFFPPKFVVSRRVVKDIIASEKNVRIALAQFGGSGYILRKRFSPTCAALQPTGATAPDTWEPYRSGYVDAVNALSWNGGTPAAASLYDVGRYFHSTDRSWFGNSRDDTAGEPAVCWSCQPSSVVLITDGVPTTGDGNNLPGAASSIADSNVAGRLAGDSGAGIRAPLAADCPGCYAFSGTNDFLNNLPKVAFYLHNYDMRKDTETTLDCKGMTGKQTVDVYTVGFGIGLNANAKTVLQNAADAGGGRFFGADSANELKKDIAQVFASVSNRSTSGSLASTQSVQTGSAAGALIPRFLPTQDTLWRGHLYRYDFVSEYTRGCTPGGDGDLDCDGACHSVFLQDKDHYFIVEDAGGQFVRVGTDFPSCDQAPLCRTSGRCNPTATTASAPPHWDAATAPTTVLAAGTRWWKTRSVWTVVDDAAPLGVVNQDDAVVALSASDTVAAQLQPYLGLGTSRGVCTEIGDRIRSAGDLWTAQAVKTSKLECAKTVIRYVLGADVFNEARRSAPEWPPPTRNGSPASATNLPDQDQLKDRPFWLGDIFHSSPVVVEPPPPADSLLAQAGFINQTIQSLWLTPTRPAVSGTNPYDQYARSSPYRDRNKLVLVGANDGMLHAFDGGTWDGVKQYGVGTGLESWAFVPPDLLAKLPLLLQRTKHPLFVDGSAMVRDVWVDGAANALGSPAAVVDDLKAPSEFHTVAVVGERRGGNRYFALDVTDAAEPGARPKFLWVYPQPSDPESLGFGETYTDFLPGPPPIGPVRIKADVHSGRVADANTPIYTTGGGSVPYHERWVVLLPGGFDPLYLRGRGVHMLDVWTGKELLDFSYDPAGGPRAGLTYPVAAVPGMVMWGKGAAQEKPDASRLVNGGFFDTATFGDTGGQLWALRFNAPGELDATGRATNWFGARIFQMGAPSCGGSLAGQPFFYVTANGAMPGNSLLRVFAGTGDRFNLLDVNGGACGPDNLRACAQKGCTVSIPPAGNVDAVTGVGSDARGLAQAACAGSSQPGFTSSASTTGTPPACGATSAARLSVTSCPGTTGGFTKDVVVTCGLDADGDYGCQAGTSANPTSASPDLGVPLDVPASLGSYPQARNWYFALRVFDPGGDRAVFTDAASAQQYDAARYALSDRVTATHPLGPAPTFSPTGTDGLAIIDGALDNPSLASLSTADAAGWALYYDHEPTVTVGTKTFAVNPLDERTAAGSALWGIATWSTMQPSGGDTSATTGTCRTSRCSGSFRRLAYHYGADPVTGGAVLTDARRVVRRSIPSETQAPPPADQPTAFLSPDGNSLLIGLASIPTEKGASNVPVTEIEPMMWLGSRSISRDVHECRHFKPEGGLTAAERAEVLRRCK